MCIKRRAGPLATPASAARAPAAPPVRRPWRAPPPPAPPPPPTPWPPPPWLPPWPPSACRRAAWPPATGSCRRATCRPASRFHQRWPCRRAAWPPAAGWLRPSWRPAAWRPVRPGPRGPTRTPRTSRLRQPTPPAAHRDAQLHVAMLRRLPQGLNQSLFLSRWPDAAHVAVCVCGRDAVV
jgi:hypothetical protein